MLRSKPHPEQGYRSALGILRLSHKFGTARLEQACERAIAIRSASYQTVKTMLKQRMEAAASAEPDLFDDAAAALGAKNVCGRGYYH